MEAPDSWRGERCDYDDNEEEDGEIPLASDCLDVWAV